MSLSFDIDAVINQLSKQREFQAYSVVKDVVVEEVYSQSPINFDAIISMSMEREASVLEASAQKAANANSAKRGTFKNCVTLNITDELQKTQEKLKVKIFEEQDPSLYEFVKEDFDKKLKIEPTALQAAMMSSGNKRLSERFDSGPVFQQLMCLLTIYLPFSTAPLKLKVGEKTTVEEVIKLAIKQYEASAKVDINNASITANPNAYLIRVAEDDGTPDEDIPGTKRLLNLIINGVSSGETTRDRFYYCSHNTEEEPQSQPQIRLFKVFITNEDSNEKGFASVMYKEEMTLRELRDIVCQKRGISNIKSYSFTHLDGGGFLDLDIKLGELSDKSGLVLSEMKRTNSGNSILWRRESLRNMKEKTPTEEGDAPRQITKLLGPMFFFTPTTATRYQQYTVIKGNKFGVKQERILGIDAERITNIVPDKKGSSAKKPVRYLKDVVRAATIPNKPRHFVIEYTDKTSKYEALKAEEIVAKINYLLQMKNNSEL